MLDHLNKPVVELKTPICIEDWDYVLKDRTKLRSGVGKIPETKELEDIETLVLGNSSLAFYWHSKTD